MSPNIYDDLDLLYREIWGASLHHGVWLTGHENVFEAQETLKTLVLQQVAPQSRVADIGCGYGILAHQLLEKRNCQVTAVTDSQLQAEQIQAHENLQILRGNWLHQKLTSHSVDTAIAIESLSHLPSFDEFLAHTIPTIAPGGKLIIADWFSDTGSSPFMKHLARSGNLPPWRSFNSFVVLAESFGLSVKQSLNLSENVAPTWSRILFRSLLLPFRKPSLLPVIVGKIVHNPSLLWAFPLLRLAYQTGDLQYRFVSFEK